MITATQLYDHVSCPRRVDLDLHGPAEGRTEISPFVRMLWQRGTLHEATVLEGLPDGALRLGGLPALEREWRTSAAMDAGVPLIQGGRIQADDLVGDPDLLIRRGSSYVAADIKSGRADEGGAEDVIGKPKAHYAVQVALYNDVLDRLGASTGRVAEIWDVEGRRVEYDLLAPRGARISANWWDLYEATRDAVRRIHDEPGSTRGALSAACGLCHWRDVCLNELQESGDLTMVPTLGRAARDAMAGTFGSLSEFAATDPAVHCSGPKTIFKGIGADRLKTFHARARLLTTPGATGYLKGPLALPENDHEIFFDIEADPLRDVVYLHGFVHRRHGDDATERFFAFTAERATPEAEREAFAAAMAHLAAYPNATVYYYSKYERTAYRKLQQRFPDVCTPEEVETIFTPPRAIDLYFDIVTKLTEWPTRNHSIKTLAKHLGFAWRDTDPSGAASIEWYNRWIEEGDRSVLQRIIDYNEDDCRATRVLLDGIRALRHAP